MDHLIQHSPAHRLLELAQEQVQPVGLHQLLNKVGRQPTAHLHLHTHYVQPGSHTGHQAALLHPHLALEEEDLQGPQPVTGGHLLQQPLQAGHISLVKAELTLANIKSRTVEILNQKENVASQKYLEYDCPHLFVVSIMSTSSSLTFTSLFTCSSNLNCTGGGVAEGVAGGVS